MVPTNLYAFILPSLPRRRPAGRSRPLAAAFFPMPTFGRSPYPLRDGSIFADFENHSRSRVLNTSKVNHPISPAAAVKPDGAICGPRTEVGHPALSKHQSRLNILTANSQAVSQNANIRPRSENTNLQEFLSPSSTDRHLEAARRSATQSPGRTATSPQTLPTQARPYSTSSLKRATVVDGSAR